VETSWAIDILLLGGVVVLGIAALVVYLLTRGPDSRGED
jgi:hypothetical protein